jgi:hypothetical protein
MMDNSGVALMIEPHKSRARFGARRDSMALEYRDLNYPSIAWAVRNV